MLTVGSQLIHVPVMSLQTGTELARTTTAVIDPRTLTILAYELSGPLLDQQPSFLRVADIREQSNIGFIVDSSDEFVGLDDVIKLQEVYDFRFQLVGLPVIDEKGKKLGKVDGYTVEIESFVIQQINVKRSLLKSLGDTELLIHRSQIVKVSDTAITVKAGTINAEPVKATVSNYVNPFRQTGKAQPEAIKADKD